MWQLIRQKNQTNIKPIICFETKNLPFELKGPASFEPRSNDVPGIVVTSKPNVLETQMKN